MTTSTVQPNLHGDFTAQKVYRRLAEKFDEAGAEQAELCHADRYSIPDPDGIKSQVGRSTRPHAHDPDVQAYLAIEEETFDPHHPELGRPAGVVHLHLSDVHPAVQSDEYVGALVRCGRTLFLRLTTSSTSRQIKRPDGPDENAYTVLMVALLNHCAGTLKEIRWSDDTRRAGRDTASWASITARASQLGTTLTFGSTRYNPNVDSMMLSVHGGLNQVDDVTRIKSLVGGRLEKLLQNTCPISEGQLPHGVRHKQHPDGRVVIITKTKFAEADLQWHPVIVEALRMHAAGSSYIDIGLVLARNNVPRRGQRSGPSATFADLVGDRAALSGATKSFFIIRGRTGAGEEHLYLAKLALWETGSYPHRFNNNLKQRDVPIGGVVPTYDGPDDVTGYFDVVLKWNIPLTGFRDDAERSAVIGKCRTRLLAERREPRQSQGRDPRDEQVRVLGGPFDRWAATHERDERWGEDHTMYGVTTRTHNSGKNCFVLVHYPASAGSDLNGRPVGLWRFTHKPALHIAGTWAANAHCASVAVSIGRAVEAQLLDADSVVPMTVMPAVDARETTTERRRISLAGRRDGAVASAVQAKEEGEGFELLAARRELTGDREGADRYLDRAKASLASAGTHADTAARLEGELVRLAGAVPAAADVHDANVTVLAYLQAGLLRASRANGRGGTLLQAAAATHLRQRRFAVRGDVIEWSCLLVVPLLEGGEAQVPLTGEIENVRERVGKALVRSDIIAQYVLGDGRSLDDVAAQMCVSRRTLLTQQLMPWLVVHGQTSRGGKNALVDHPLPLVQRIVFATLAGKPDPAVLRWGPTVTDHLVATYLDPDLAWGDAACPDDVTWVDRAVATVAQEAAADGRGVPVLDLALALGVTEGAVRALVAPLKRDAGGFTRPRYLQYADRTKTRVRAFDCPHRSCRGRRVADHVVLLPEVAATGFGVICSHCRRAPSTDLRWAALQFPHVYLQPWTNRGPGGSLRIEPQTLAAVSAGPLALGSGSHQGTADLVEA